MHSTRSLPYSTLRRSESGMISIMTTLILIIVVSLIVLGFAQIARRNQRESLDRQLSTQAFYAAETGVNDALKVIGDAVTNGTAVPDKNSCADTGAGGFYASLNATIDAAADVKYSCLTVDASPESLRFGDVDDESIVVPVISANGTNISRINLTWQAKVTGNPLTGCPTGTAAVFSPTSSWNCGYGVLRFDLVPTGGNNNAAGLQAATMTSFLVPRTAGVNAIPYNAGAANANTKASTLCTATQCSMSITGLSQNNYHMRISSLYRNVSLQITAESNTGTILSLAGAQALIDSTGRAQDVLRRVQVYVPLRTDSTNQLSDFAIQSNDSICKRFSVMDGFFDGDDRLSTIPSPKSRLCNAVP